MTARELFASAPWRHDPTPCRDATYPPGYLNLIEATMFRVLARDYFSGAGVIVDGGTWLGKSAALLAQGLRENTQVTPSACVHTFDRFVVNDDSDADFIREQIGQTLAVGASTRSMVDGHLRPWADLIHVHEGDFRAGIWSGEPIEILLLDICKTREANQRVIEQFFPALMPGRSILIQQDYHHCHLPFIHMSMECLAEYFEPLATRVDDSCVWLLSRRIPGKVLQDAASVWQKTPGEKFKLMDKAIARLPEHERHFVQLARVLLYRFHGYEQAIAALDALPDSVSPQDQQKWDGEREQIRARLDSWQSAKKAEIAAKLVDSIRDYWKMIKSGSSHIEARRTIEDRTGLSLLGLVPDQSPAVRAEIPSQPGR